MGSVPHLFKMPERNCGIIEIRSGRERILSVNDIHPSSTKLLHYTAYQENRFKQDISNPKLKVVAAFWSDIPMGNERLMEGLENAKYEIRQNKQYHFWQYAAKKSAEREMQEKMLELIV